MTEVVDDDVVLEGFLCPICKVDFGLDLKLFLHFQEAHSEDQDLVKSFKGTSLFSLIRADEWVNKYPFAFNNNLSRLDLFGKAKEKILKNDIVKKEERRHVWEPQKIGL